MHSVHSSLYFKVHLYLNRIRLIRDEREETEKEQGLKRASREQGSDFSCSRTQCFLYLKKEKQPQEWKDGCPETRDTENASPVCASEDHATLISSHSGFGLHNRSAGLKIQCITEWLDKVWNCPHSPKGSQGGGNGNTPVCIA